MSNPKIRAMRKQPATEKARRESAQLARAAHEYRLEQARRLIAEFPEFAPPKFKEPDA